MENATGYELSWDSTIENDGPDWEPIPEGDYNFEVVSFERGRHNGSSKLPPCNKAILTLRLDGNGHSTTTTHNLFLHSKTEGMVCAFFTAIGQRKRGEKLTMDWTKVVGSTGRCKVVVRTWNHKTTGEVMRGNEIKKFYEPTVAAPKGFEPGKGF